MHWPHAGRGGRPLPCWETEPFALGTVPGLAAGATTVANSQVILTMNLGDDSIRGYCQNALDRGVTSLNVASLHAADGIGIGSYPRFSSRESTTASRRPSLEIDYAIVPEPTCACSPRRHLPSRSFGGEEVETRHRTRRGPTAIGDLGSTPSVQSGEL